jgi:hypothetical protein
MNKTYTYYCRLRPPGPGCQPRGFISIDFNSTKNNGREYWGSVTYDRQLTDDEIFNYDLDYITPKRKGFINENKI